MKLGIIGYGFVGEAISWAHRHHTLVIRDPKLENSADYSDFLNCDAIYVCVPSPEKLDGHCDTTILENTLKELLFVLINKSIPIICKTTAPPTIYEKLHQQYPNIVHCPEFLTAANNVSDYQNSDYFILGGHKEWCVKSREIIRQGVPLVDEKFLITDIKSASLYKYMMNSYLASKVTFMNDFKKLADAIGITWKSFKDLSLFENRIGYTHMDVPGPDGNYGWGGACFPKDISAIINEAKDVNVDLDMLTAVNNINKIHRKKND